MSFTGTASGRYFMRRLPAPAPSVSFTVVYDDLQTTGSVSSNGTWKFSTSATANSGNTGTNDWTTAVQSLFLYDQTAAGVDLTNFYETLQSGDRITVTHSTKANQFAYLTINSVSIASDVVTIRVTTDVVTTGFQDITTSANQNAFFGFSRGSLGDPGAGFWRIPRSGAKPTGTTPAPTVSEFGNVAGRPAREGDIAAVVYDEVNSFGVSSCGFQYNGTAWEIAGKFVDGNLIVDGAIFSTVSVAVGIPNINDALDWDNASDLYPQINTSWTGSGAFMGFADNDQTGSTVTQEVLLVGDAANHLFFDGQNLTLSGVTITDPTILVTPEMAADAIAGWSSTATYELGALVTYTPAGATDPNIYRSLITNNIGNLPTDTNSWIDITTVVEQSFTPTIAVTESSPPNASHGNLWYDTTLAKMFVFVAHDPDADITNGTWADSTWL